MRSICLVVMLSLVLPILSLGAVLNVPTDYATAAEALEWVQEGDTVLLEPGTYSGLGFQDIEYSGPNCWIIGGDEPENTIIDLKGGYFVHVYASAQWEWPVVGIETATFTNGRQAIDLGEYSTTNIRDCIFFQNEVALTDSVWFSSGSIVSCRFVDNDTAYLLGGESYESFYDCVFESNTVAVHSVGGLNADFLNCVFVGNILAFSLDFNSFLSIANSCISHNLIGIRDYSYDADLYLECNNVFGNDIDYYGCPDQTGINGNISQEPYFCDTTFSTLSVASISPLLPEHNSLLLRRHQCIRPARYLGPDLSGQLYV
jgi:hypothetical protein